MFDDVLPEAGGVDALLQPLTGLAGLTLSYIEDFAPPAALGQLSQLQWLYINTQCACMYALPMYALPEGSWVGSLRRLAIKFYVIEASVPQLRQAMHLSCLSLLTLPEKGAPELLRCWSAFWQFVASHPPLRILEFRVSDDEDDDEDEPRGMVPVDVLEACMWLAIRRPSLRVAMLTVDSDWPLDELKAMDPSQEA